MWQTGLSLTRMPGIVASVIQVLADLLVTSAFVAQGPNILEQNSLDFATHHLFCACGPANLNPTPIRDAVALPAHLIQTLKQREIIARSRYSTDFGSASWEVQ